MDIKCHPAYNLNSLKDKKENDVHHNPIYNIKIMETLYVLKW